MSEFDPTIPFETFPGDETAAAVFPSDMDDEGMAPGDCSLHVVVLDDPTYIDFIRRKTAAPVSAWQHDDDQLIASLDYDGSCYFLTVFSPDISRGIWGMTTSYQVAQGWKNPVSLLQILEVMC